MTRVVVRRGAKWRNIHRRESRAAVIENGKNSYGDGEDIRQLFQAPTLPSVANAQCMSFFFSEKNQGAGFATPAFIQSLVCVGDEAGKFYAFDAATGKQKWAIDLGAAVSAGANVLGNRAYVASAAGSVFCVDVTAGEVLWKAECGDQIRSTPTILGDHVIVSGCDAKLHILDLKTGKTIKTKELGAPTMSTPAGSDSSLILGTQEGVMSLNLNDGDKPLWKFVTPRGNAEFRGSPAVTESTVYIGGGNRSVYALNRSTGEVLWQTAVKGRVDASPIVVGDMILIGSHDGRLYLMNRATGDVAWSYDTGGNIRSSTAVANRHAVIANERGVVYCFGE